MREIKFHVWDKTTKILYKDNEIQIQYSDNNWIALPYGKDSKVLQDFVLMQFTGLHDKNNKEIWENDIVKYYFDTYCGSDTVIGVITFGDGGYWIECESSSIDITGVENVELELLGNF